MLEVPWPRPRVRAALLLAAFSSALAERPATGLRPAQGSDSPSHILVFDAGSSGTRIHVFNMLPPRPGERVPAIDLSVRPNQTYKEKPGLSKFARDGDLNGSQVAIERLLNFADTFVPKELRPHTPALLKATAGLRAVPSHLAEAVLERIRATLASSEYAFCNSWAGIIPGAEEAGLAWVTANYLEGTFDSGESSVGVIEMGGGSTQVTFQVDEPDLIPQSDRFDFTTVSGQRYHLYAHSYPGYGQDYAQEALQQRIPAESSEDPCYPLGYQRGVTTLVKGSGNAEACESLVQGFFAESEQAPGSYHAGPSLSGRFVATENFVHARHDLSLPLEGGVDSMSKAAVQACQHAAEETPTDPMKPNFCFALAYQVAFLSALGVRQDGGVDVRIAEKINGSDLDWAVGAALVHALGQQRCPPQSTLSFLPGPPEGYTPWFVALFGAMVITAMLVRRFLPRIHRHPGVSGPWQPSKLP